MFSLSSPLTEENGETVFLQSAMGPLLQKNKTYALVIVTLLVIPISLLARWLLQKPHHLAIQISDVMEPPVLPYWIPFMGHLPNLILQPDKLFKWTRDNKPYGAFAIDVMGYTFNVVWMPDMVQTVFSQRHSVLNTDALLQYCAHTIGGIPRKFSQIYKTALHPLMQEHSVHLLREPEASKMYGETVRNISENVPNLVTFMHSIVDQMPWERESDACPIELENGDTAVDVDFLPLIINFVAHQSIPSLFGTDLLRNYPDLLKSLWAFNSGFFLLASGLPWWFPFPALQRAHRGRAYLLTALTAMQGAMDVTLLGGDVGSQWSNLEDASTMIWDRHAYYRKLEIPAYARADLTLLWALNANANFLVFWLLLRIYSDAALLAELRDEIAPYVSVTTPPRDFAIPEPPRVVIDEKALSNSCPLLKACYIESLRLDSTPGALKSVKKDFTILNSGSTRESNTAATAALSTDGTLNPKSYLFKAGTFILVPLDLHSTDPAYWPDPDIFNPRRHIVHKSVSSATSHPTPNSTSSTHAASTPTATFSTLRPFGGGSSACPGRLFAEKEVLASVAAVLALWELEPVDSQKGWHIPGHVKTPGVAQPSERVRVRIRRRRDVWGR